MPEGLHADELATAARMAAQSGNLAHSVRAWTAQPPQSQTVWTALTEREEVDYLDAQMRTGPPVSV